MVANRFFKRQAVGAVTSDIHASPENAFLLGIVGNHGFDFRFVLVVGQVVDLLAECSFTKEQILGTQFERKLECSLAFFVAPKLAEQITSCDPQVRDCATTDQQTLEFCERFFPVRFAVLSCHLDIELTEVAEVVVFVV